MLEALSIRDFVIVESIDLEFGPGFTVLTGETGAGKSILIDALSLTLGERGDPGAIRSSAERTEVTAQWRAPEAASAWLHSSGLSESDELVVRRTVDRQGRSRAWINGSPVSVSQLRELADRLIDIHGQHAHQALLRNDYQRELLDNHAQLAASLVHVRSTWSEWQTLLARKTAALESADQRRGAQEELEWEAELLERLAPREGEWAAIAQEQQRLSNAAELIEGLEESLMALAEADDSLTARLASVMHRVAGLERLDESVKPVQELLEAGRIQLQEATYALRDYRERLDLDPERLKAVESRMDALHSAARRLKVEPDALASRHASTTAKLATLGADGDLEALAAACDKAQASYLEHAQQLSKARAKAAVAFGAAVTEAMQTLSLAGGRFAVRLIERPAGPDGLEHVEFEVAGHEKAALRPLSKVASGGELSRIGLAISVLASGARAVQTLIFDEVDSGVGGAVAEVVGRLLRTLGQDRQVLAVTHLPQVAAQAQHHYVVAKAKDAEGVTSEIVALSASERIDEIARMLGGIDITATTRRHARELLSMGKQDRAATQPG